MAVLAPEILPALASAVPFFNQKYPSGAVPEAVTLNVAFFPAATLAATGDVVMAGAVGVVVPVMVMVMLCESDALPGLTIVTVVGKVPAAVGVPEKYPPMVVAPLTQDAVKDKPAGRVTAVLWPLYNSGDVTVPEETIR